MHTDGQWKAKIHGGVLTDTPSWSVLWISREQPTSMVTIHSDLNTPNQFGEAAARAASTSPFLEVFQHLQLHHEMRDGALMSACVLTFVSLGKTVPLQPNS